MFNYIEKLRNKSDSEKKQMAFLTSFTFVGIIFIFWLSIIFPTFTEEKHIIDKASAREKSPFSTFFSIISQGKSAISEQISNIKDASASLLTGSEHYVSTSTPPLVYSEIGTTTEE